MGTRYDFDLTVNLKEDVPDEIVEVVEFLLIPDKQPPAHVPDDPLFSGQWQEYRFANWVHSCEPNAGETICALRNVHRYTQRGVDHYQYTLQLRFAGKLETVVDSGIAFAMWIAKRSDQDGCVGYYRAADARHPTLLYFHDGELYITPVTEPPRRATDGATWD